MTNQEAADILYQITYYDHEKGIPSRDLVMEALKLAISVLKTQEEYEVIKKGKIIINDKLNKIINDLYYILDCLNNYKEIINSGDCNSCFNNKNCKYKPKLGQLVRYNCPFYLNYNEGKAKNNGF